MHPISINILKNLDLGVYMGSYIGLALAPLQNFTHSRRQESPGDPPGLNTAFHIKCEHTANLRKGEKNGSTIHRELLFQPQRRIRKRGSCKGPEQIFIHKILNQCKGQSTPFFQIIAKFHFLLISHCLVPFPAAWESFTAFSPRGGRDTVAPCYRRGWRHRERKDQAHLLQFRHPKVHRPSLN